MAAQPIIGPLLFFLRAFISFQTALAWLPSKPTLPISNQLNTVKNENVYSKPALYDLAFGYRNYDEEVDFLMSEHQKLTGQHASKVLELMAGPARHSLSALELDEVSTVWCVDNEPAMSDYANSLWEENAISGKNLHYQVADVRSFLMPVKVDTVWILLGSFQHMIGPDDAVDCLARAREALHDQNSTLFLELPHPRELFVLTDCTKNEWTVPLDLSDGTTDELQILWGDAEKDTFDPITQIRQHSVALRLKNNETDAVETTIPLRSFTAPEIQSLAALTGFRVAAWYGALEDGVRIDDEDLAFRMVCCLQPL